MDQTSVWNIYEAARGLDHGEVVAKLVEGESFALERIVSLGHVTPEDEWYDQPRDEWIVLLTGKAHLRFEDAQEELRLSPGDSLLIKAHHRHRVTWTDPQTASVWLALHFAPGSES